MGRKDSKVIRVHQDFAKMLEEAKKKSGKSISEITKEFAKKLRRIGVK